MQVKSAELEARRRTEILDACARIYAEKGFHDVTTRGIGQEISCSRPTIYNYFESKEEIFLGLLARESKAWLAELDNLEPSGKEPPKEEFAAKVAETLERRAIMLRIMAMNVYDIEEKSRLERLTEYKELFLQEYLAFGKALRRFMQDADEEKIAKVQRAFFPFMAGVYPYAHPTDKQREAMEKAGLDYKPPAIREAVEEFLLQIL